MKKLILLASCAALASCMGKAPETEETAAAAAPATEAVAAAATPAATEAVAPGSYDVTYPDGTKSVDTLMADGTYVSRDASDKVTDKGKWAVKDGKTCFAPEGKAEECFTEGPRAADGSFSATGADGKITQVKPHAKM